MADRQRYQQNDRYDRYNQNNRQQEQFFDQDRQYDNDRNSGMRNRDDQNFGSSRQQYRQGGYNQLDDYDNQSYQGSRSNYGGGYDRDNRSHNYMRGDEMGGPAMTGPYTTGSGSYGGSSYYGGGRSDRSMYGNDGNNDRGFFEKAGDKIESWFSDDDADRYGRRGRRTSGYGGSSYDNDYDDDDRYSRNSYRGHGPKNYTRSDSRIMEDVCDRLSDDHDVDARNIDVTVNDREVTLDGTVRNRRAKRRAEDCIHDLSGVSHVQNNLRIDDDYDNDDDSNRNRYDNDGLSDASRSVRRDADATNKSISKTGNKTTT